MEKEYKGLKENLERFKSDLTDEKTKLLFSIAYKQGYDEALTIPAVSNLLCGSFDPDNSTSSATKCKCGREKWEHPKAT